MQKRYLTRQDLKVVSFGIPGGDEGVRMVTFPTYPRPPELHILPHAGIPGAKRITPMAPPGTMDFPEVPPPAPREVVAPPPEGISSTTKIIIGAIALLILSQMFGKG